MVDSVGNKPFTVGDRQVGRVERAIPARASQRPATTEARSPAGGLGQVARDLAAAPPVDADRVARIRRAIAENRFPLSPTTVADRLIAFRLNWTGDDQA